jgi:fucose permease
MWQKVIDVNLTAAFKLSRWLIGFTGFFIGPTIMGQIAQHLGLRASFFCVAMLMAVILPLIWGLGRRRAAA